VKMWARERFRAAVVFCRQTFILVVSYQEIYSVVRVIMNGRKISTNGKQIWRHDSSGTSAIFTSSESKNLRLDIKGKFHLQAP